jgi:IS30 family transposase
MKCTLEKFLYTGHKAHLISTQMAKQSREGIAVSPAEITRLNQVISPLVKQGQSIHNIFMTHKDEIMADESTIYRYIKLGLFDAKVTDLLNVVKMKPRRVKPKLKVDKAYIKGREYRSFLKFIQDNPDMPIVQMDTVEGQKGHGEPVLLTMHFVEAELMLAFKREANTAQSVTDIVDKLYKRLGHDTFTNLFQVILCDQGSEFSNPCAIENTLKGTSRTRIFYTEPSAPYQKGACENNHSLIRRIIPKGTSLRGYSPKNITLMMNHINSYKRKKLKAKSPIETFNFFHDPLILKKLGVTLVKPDDVILNPSLFK